MTTAPMINTVMSRRSLLLRPKASASAAQRIVVVMAHKTAITEASNHLCVADGFMFLPMAMIEGLRRSRKCNKQLQAEYTDSGRSVIWVVYDKAMLRQLRVSA